MMKTPQWEEWNEERTTNRLAETDQAARQWAEAANGYEKILKTFPQDARIHLVRGRLSEAKV